VLQQALKVSLCQQVPLLAFSSLILDGGVVLARVVTAVLAYWVVTLFILLARRWRVSAYDRLFLKWGFFLLLAASFLWQAITAH
jgi:hypothetical protein